MRNLGRIVGHIPARGGSKRVPSKNLRYLGPKPMIQYAIECAAQSGVVDEVYVNTDSDELARLAMSLGATVYRRNAELASDTASGDDFTADFLRAVRPDTLLMISPVCPLVEPGDVRRAVEAFQNSDCDTLITCHETRMQTFCEGRPVNIDLNGALAPTQNNPPVQILNWAVTIWDAPAFMEAYDKTGSAYIGTRRLLLPLDPMHGVKISVEEDFHLAEMLIKARGLTIDSEQARYWPAQHAEK